MAKQFYELSNYVKGEYRYLYCLSRLDGSSIRFSRNDAKEKMAIIQESHSVQKPEKDDTDYLHSYTMQPISEDYFNELLFEISADDFHWTHVSVYRTENIRADDADQEYVENLYLWLFDIPLIQFGKIGYITTKNNSALIKIRSKTFGNYSIGNFLFIKKDGKLLKYTINSIGKINKLTNEFIVTVRAEDASTLVYLEKDDWVINSNDINNIETIYEGEISYYPDYTLVELTFPLVFPSDVNIYDNFLILWEDGKTSVVVEKISTSTAIIKHIDGAPSKIDSSDEEISLKFVILHRSTGNNGNYKFKFGDSITDELLKARKESQEYLYYLQTRFFEPLTNGNLSCIKNGCYFNGTKDRNKYEYSQLGTIWRGGYFHPSYQISTINYGKLTRLSNLPDGVVIFGEHFTLFIDTSIINNVGVEEYGEYIAQFQTPQLITDEIGCVYNSDPAKLNRGEIIVTNEPSIRFFNGYNYADDITYKSINKSILIKLKPNVITHWNPNIGYLLWGIKDE